MEEKLVERLGSAVAGLEAISSVSPEGGWRRCGGGGNGFDDHGVRRFAVGVPYRRTRRIYNEKQKHAFALELGKRLIKEEREWSRYLVDRMGSPIVEATEKGIIELVNEILEKFPEAAFSFDRNSRDPASDSSPNDKGKNILHIVVEQKDWNIYDLLRRKIELRDGMLGDVDNHGNTILHLAAKLGAPSFRSIQRGHLYQMMWDVCWFKHVSYDSPPHVWNLRNSDGETAKEVFEKEHSEIREKAEKTVKDMNNGLMLIVALIGTVNYAALFTPPGGYRQSEKDPSYGLPVFLTDDMRMYYLHISCGLFAAFVAFANMFSIQSCPFRCNDFYLDLPLRLLVAMIFFMLSVVFTSLASRQKKKYYVVLNFCPLEDSKMASSRTSTISVTRSAAFRAASDCEPRSRLSSFATVREFWIQEGAIPLDAGGNTILHFLAMYGNAFVIQKLIDDNGNNNNNCSSSIVKCGDLFGRNDKGNTPLHEAVRFGRKNVVEILLRKQESLVRERNCLGETPVYIVCD
ncbi:hypothetical protein RHGRI_016194 [Rhododendron griersonianum]|uniref:PGG domain-containing protein n=1 Tax=Rhododendron griersonianum TaxID=479676 RepID=A0AAV6JTF7_9ERIC|nr:hypothetical protein RHGRI_016194 [Rhododendron griersonianum]